MKKELLKGLTEEQIAKVRACKSHEELLKLVKEEDVELNEEQLDAVSGGSCTGSSLHDARCPHCGAKVFGECVGDGKYIFRCARCDYEWKEK